ncbi:MAG: PAS domain S-box protein [Candidatus Omnitrophota bacterium]
MNMRNYARSSAFVLIFIVLIVSLGFSFLVINLEDKSLREELLDQARILGKSIDSRRILSLSGSEADLLSLDYHRLKEQLILACSANPKFRFTYLLGKKPSGEIFFFVDSEPQDSPDYSPPGQVFTEIASNIKNIFLTNKELIEGPTADRWGIWVSALVPVIDPETAKLIAVVGVDIDARDWKLLIFSRALPLVIIDLLIIFLFLGFLFFQWRREQEKIRVELSKVALQRSEEIFKQLFENMMDGVAVYREVNQGEDFVFVDLNKKGEEISQVKRGNIFGKKVTAVFPAVAEIGLLGALRRVWRTGIAEALPGVLYKDKRIEHWSENYILKLSSGLVVVIYSNFPKSKQLDQEIESLAKFPSEDPNPVMRITRDGKLFFVNLAGLEQLKSWILEVGQLAPDLLRDWASRVLESGLAQNFDIEYGEKIYSFHVVPVLKAGYANLYGSNVTERKLVEKKLAELNYFLQSIIDNMDIWLDVFDNQGNIIIWNKAAELISGYSADEAMGKKNIWSKLYPETVYRSQVIKQFHLLVQNQKSFSEFETILRCKNGQDKVIIWKAKGLIDSHDQGMGSIALGYDITERKLVEKQMIKNAKEMEIFYKASLNREERIIELKQEVQGLKNKLKQGIE